MKNSKKAMGLKISLIITILLLVWFIFIPSTDKAPRGSHYQVQVVEYYDAGGYINAKYPTYYNVKSIHEFKWGFTLLKDSELGHIWVRTQDIQNVRTHQGGIYIYLI